MNHLHFDEYAKEDAHFGEFKILVTKDEKTDNIDYHIESYHTHHHDHEPSKTSTGSGMKHSKLNLFKNTRVMGTQTKLAELEVHTMKSKQDEEPVQLIPSKLSTIMSVSAAAEDEIVEEAKKLEMEKANIVGQKGKIRKWFIIVMILSMVAFRGYLASFIPYITTYVTEYLQKDEKYGRLIISTYYATKAIGKILIVPIFKKMDSVAVLWVNYVFIFVFSLIFIVLQVLYQTEVSLASIKIDFIVLVVALYIIYGGIGFFMSGVAGAVFGMCHK